MATIALISCGKKKLPNKAKAKDLYVGPLFKGCLAYAQKKIKTDSIYILSAKHHLVDLDKDLERYDHTLKNMTADENRHWANVVLKQLAEKTDLKNDVFVVLAGKSYRKNLMGRIDNFIIPLEGMSIGKQLKFLNNQLA